MCFDPRVEMQKASVKKAPKFVSTSSMHAFVKLNGILPHLVTPFRVAEN